MVDTPQNPINPANFPNPGGGPTPAEVARFQATVAEAASKLGVKIEKSYIDAYKKVTKVAEIFEKHIMDLERKRFAMARSEIGKQYAEEFLKLRQKGEWEKRQGQEKEKLIKNLYKAEEKARKDIAKESTRPGFGARVGGALQKEVTSLPLVGNFAATLMEVGPAAAFATGSIAALFAILGKVVDSMFKMNIAATRTDIALTKAGLSQDVYGKKLGGAFQDIPKVLAGPEDFAKWLSVLSVAPKALKDVGKDNKGFENFLGHMGQMGVTLDDSVEKTAKAALTWGGTFKDLDKQFYMAKKLTKDTGYGFDTLFDAMQDLNPMMKNMTFSTDEAAKASADFVTTVMTKFSKMGLSADQAKGMTEALASFVSQMSGPKMLGLAALTQGGLPKNIDKFFEGVEKHPENMVDMFLKGSQKVVGQMPAGQKSLGIMGMAEQGMLPAMFNQPMMASALAKLLESGGTDKAAMHQITGYMKDEQKQAADRAAGFATLANLNNPITNMVSALNNLVDSLCMNGPMISTVRSINDVITSPQKLNPMQLLPQADPRGWRTKQAEQAAKTSVSQSLPHGATGDHFTGPGK